MFLSSYHHEIFWRYYYWQTLLSTPENRWFESSLRLLGRSQLSNPSNLPCYITIGYSKTTILLDETDVTNCEPCNGITNELVPGSITVCSMGPSVAQGVKITGLYHPPPLRAGNGRRRLVAQSSYSIMPFNLHITQWYLLGMYLTTRNRVYYYGRLESQFNGIIFLTSEIPLSTRMTCYEIMY